MSELINHFKAVMPYLTAQTTQTFFKNSLYDSIEQAAQKIYRAKLVILNEQRRCQYKHRSKLMAGCSSSDFLIYAFCEVESQKSIIKVHLFGKRSQHQSYFTLNIKNRNVTIIKLLLREEGLQLIVGTRCGQILTYNKFESGNPQARCSKISTYPLTDMVQPRFNNTALLILAENGVIYQFDIKKHLICHQFQGELPLFLNKKTQLIIDNSQTLIGCAFSYGKIMLWQLDQTLKAQLTKHQSIDSGEQTQIDESKIKVKKQSKRQFSSKKVIKSYLTNLCCEGFKWAKFSGKLLVILTSIDLLKIYAVAYEQKSNQCQLYYLLYQTLLISKQCQMQKQRFYQKVDKIFSFSQGIIICINKWKNNNSLTYISSRLQKYVFTENFTMEKRIQIILPASEPIEDIFWYQQDQFLMYKSQNQYSLLLIPELRDS